MRYGIAVAFGLVGLLIGGLTYEWRSPVGTVVPAIELKQRAPAPPDRPSPGSRPQPPPPPEAPPAAPPADGGGAAPVPVAPAPAGDDDDDDAGGDDDGGDDD